MIRAAAPLLVLTALLAGCRQSMERQPKLTTYSEAAAFPHDAAARPLPTGTIDRAALARQSALDQPPATTRELLARGREQFDIFCSPCHSTSGHGDGMIVQRGFPQPPSFHLPRLITAPARHYINVITHGHGVMYPYAARIAPTDRWAIVAYIRALQLSQDASLASMAAGAAEP